MNRIKNAELYVVDVLLLRFHAEARINIGSVLPFVIQSINARLGTRDP
jgi:hypothetical protein